MAPGNEVGDHHRQLSQVLRARWGDDGSRIAVGFVPKGGAKSVVGLAHEKLATAEDAKAAKAFWTERMKALKQLLS